MKGTVESEDRDLSFLAVPIMRQATLHSYLLNRDYTSMLSTLEFTLGHIVFSTEATISVRVIDGSWRDEFHALFAASTTSIYHKKIVLLYSKDEKIVLTDDGNIKLSRSVASVEIDGKLKVSVRAWRHQEVLTMHCKMNWLAHPMNWQHLQVTIMPWKVNWQHLEVLSMLW